MRKKRKRAQTFNDDEPWILPPEENNNPFVGGGGLNSNPMGNMMGGMMGGVAPTQPKHHWPAMTWNIPNNIMAHGVQENHTGIQANVPLSPQYDPFKPNIENAAGPFSPQYDPFSPAPESPQYDPHTPS